MVEKNFFLALFLFGELGKRAKELCIVATRKKIDILRRKSKNPPFGRCFDGHLAAV